MRFRRNPVAGLVGALTVGGFLVLSWSLASSALAHSTRPGTRAPTAAPRAAEGAPIPGFSRMYGTACSTCHTAAPKLNVLGEAFRLNGYRMPPSQLLVREDEPVSLGAPEWDEAWPRAIPSSDLPGIVPLAIRVVSDARVTRDEREPYDATYLFPEGIHLLAGAPLGDDVAVFLDAGWHADHGFEVSQARVELQDVVPGLPPRAFNLWVGLQDPYLLTLGHRQIDRAARQRLSWETFEPSRLQLGTAAGSPSVRSTNRSALGRSQPTVEVNGLFADRLYYGAGLAQGVGEGATDANGRKDLYYKLRYKLGGLDLAGAYDAGDAPEQDVTGQLLDRALVLEHFGYFGDESTAASPRGGHRAFGVAARALLGRLDLGAGYVFRDFDRPWPELSTGRLDADAVFLKAEYLALPWVVGSLKAERFDVDVRGLPSAVSVTPAPDESTRLFPGVVLLLRQNLRFVAEGELFLRNPETDRADLPRPHNLWLRLDVAF